MLFINRLSGLKLKKNYSVFFFSLISSYSYCIFFYSNHCSLNFSKKLFLSIFSLEMFDHFDVNTQYSSSVYYSITSYYCSWVILIVVLRNELISGWKTDMNINISQYIEWTKDNKIVEEECSSTNYVFVRGHKVGSISLDPFLFFIFRECITRYVTNMVSEKLKF